MSPEILHYLFASSLILYSPLVFSAARIRAVRFTGILVCVLSCLRQYFFGIKLELIMIGKTNSFHSGRQDAHYRERQDRLDREADLLRASKILARI